MYHAQYPGVMVDIVGLENNEWGMGVVVTLTGAAAFVGIPFAGQSTFYSLHVWTVLLWSQNKSFFYWTLK